MNGYGGRTPGHRALRESLGAYALGQLADGEATAVRAHLDGCPACRADLADIEPVVGPLSRVDPAHLGAQPAPPPWLGSRIVAAARAESPRPDAAPRRRAPRLAVAAAAALLVGGGVGFAAGAARGVADVPREPVAVRAVGLPVDASATLVDHTWGMEITLVGEGFERGAVYHVVVRDAAGREVDAGEFIGTGEQEIRCNLNSSVLRRDATGFAVLDEVGAVVLAGII